MKNKYKNKYKYKTVTFIVASIICLIVIYLHLLSHQKTQKIYLEQTEKVIVDLKKNFLKDTVNNTFLEIDRLRETKYNSYKKNTESRLKRFEEELVLTEDEFIKTYKDRFNEDLSSKMWTAGLWNKKTGEVLYSTPDLDSVDIESTRKSLESILSSGVVIEDGDIEGIFGVNKIYIEEVVKEEILSVIKNRKFSGDSYIWVNEIVNYDGGDNYAIRKVHPNLGNTEGTFLSTDTEDIKGNKPYLEELQGVKENGEIFFTYYFKKLNSLDISEKITYAKLYKDYNWIIAMGVHWDEVDAYTSKTSNEINSLSTESIIRLLRYIFIVLLIGFVILYIIEKDHLSTSTSILEKQVNIDSLTKSFSRRYGEKSLDNLFKEFLLLDQKISIMMFDVDNFKVVNDKYGHEVGDLVLIKIVETINDHIRSSDQLIRWGGDEFVCILPGLREENMIKLGKKLSEEISSLKIPVEEENISVTISVGLSDFKNTDIDYNDALKRADDAMYESKRQGKNRVNRFL